MNRRGNEQEISFVKIVKEIYQRRRRKEEELNPGIVNNFRNLEPAEYLAKCPMFGELYENGGLRISRWTEKKSVMEVARVENEVRRGYPNVMVTEVQ